MSSVASVSSIPDPYQPTAANNFAQSVQDFNALGSALQSGDLSSAQRALTAFQQDLQGNSQAASNQPFGQNNQANTDFKSLTDALKSGNLSAAKTAFTSLQKDLQGAGKTHGHHHHGSGGSKTTPPAAPTATLASANDGTGIFINATA